MLTGQFLNGLIIIDENGRVVQRINKSSGLQNNTILSLYADNEQNLWTGLDNGIDRIELNSPLYFYFDKNGVSLVQYIPASYSTIKFTWAPTRGYFIASGRPIIFYLLTSV